MLALLLPILIGPTGGVHHGRSRNLEVSNAFLNDFEIADRRRLGSSYKFCLIAAGEADIYPQLGDTRENGATRAEADRQYRRLGAKVR